MYCLSYCACRIFKKLFANNSIYHYFFPLIPDVHLSVSHNEMFNSFSFLQIKHILTKKNFEMYLRAGKTDIFSVFYVENGKIQSMLRFYVCFNV